MKLDSVVMEMTKNLLVLLEACRVNNVNCSTYTYVKISDIYFICPVSIAICISIQISIILPLYIFFYFTVSLFYIFLFAHCVLLLLHVYYWFHCHMTFMTTYLNCWLIHRCTSAGIIDYHRLLLLLPKLFYIYSGFMVTWPLL